MRKIFCESRFSPPGWMWLYPKIGQWLLLPCVGSDVILPGATTSTGLLAIGISQAVPLCTAGAGKTPRRSGHTRPLRLLDTG